MPSRILNFSADRLITGINIIDNMLFFTDNENEPRKINIPKFKGELIDPQSNEVIKVTHPTNGGATEIYGREFKERDISVLKEHPMDALTTSITEQASFDFPDLNSLAPEYLSADFQNIEVYYIGDIKNDKKNTTLEARVDNGKNIIENGFYFTQTDPGDAGADAVITQNNKIELNNMIAFNVAGESRNFEHKISESSLSVGFMWVVAYVKEEGFDTVYSDLKKIQIGDANSTTNPISKLEVALSVGFAEGNFYPFLKAEAIYETLSPEQVSKDGVGFYISKGYSNSNESITTESLIKEAQENFTKKLPGQVGADTLSEDKQIFTYTSQGKNIGVEIGDTYYVVAYILTESGPIYSTPVSSAITDKVTVEYSLLPHVIHSQFHSAGNGAILQAEVAKYFATVGNVQKLGFLVSTSFGGGNSEVGAEELKKAFSLGFNANGRPIDQNFPNTFRFIVKELDVDFEFATNEFEYDTKQHDLNNNIISISGYEDGVVPVGTNLHVLAFAQMTTGQTVFATTSKTVKVTNIEESALIITKMELKEFNIPFYASDMKFDVELDVTYVPPNSEIIQIGIVADLPRGQEINAETVKNGFDSKQVLRGSSPIEKASDPRLSSSVFDFTATSSATDHEDIGTYSTKSSNPLVLPKLSEDDVQKYSDISGGEASETKQLQGITAYAFMTVKYQDNTQQTFETPIRHGTWDDLAGFENTSTGQSSANTGAPQVKTYSNEPTSVNRSKWATSITNNSFIAHGSLAANGNKPPSIEPVAELGFYVSTIPRPDYNLFSSDAWTTAMTTWIADAATVKIPLTGSITAYQTHGKSNNNTWKDFQITINSSNYTPGVTADTDYYIAAYCIPAQETISTSSAFPTLLDITNTFTLIRNKTKFGNIENVKTVTNSTATATTVDAPPTIMIDSAKIIQDGSAVNLSGKAFSNGANYSVQNPGFYAKPSQYINSGWNTAQIINDLATVSANRITVNADSFIKETGRFNGKLTNISEAHHVIAFAQTVTINGNTNTIYSTNFAEFDNDSVSPPANDQFIKFDTPSATINGVLNASCILSEATVNSGNFGFYIVGREGSNFQKPADNTALKAIIDNPSASDIVETITLNKSFTNPFRATFIPKTNHKYYFVAFATTASGNFSMSPVAPIKYKAATNQKIQLSDYIVEFEQDGYNYITNQTSADITVVTTPTGAPWKFEKLSWGGPGYLEPTISKLGNNKLRIQTQNGADIQTRTMRILISLAENSNVTAEVVVIVKGQSQFGYNDFNDIQDTGKSPFAYYN